MPGSGTSRIANAGRTVKAATVEPGGVLVLFDDQSKMKIKTTGPETIPPGR
jgi:hypothetical protein